MKYSFIVPTYNSGRWIKQCINSILAQSHAGFNLIIIDSGSTDDTLKWIRSLNDERISIYETQTRLSIVENWERIKSIPRNEFMTIAGHDDVFYPDYLQTMHELILNNPSATLFQTHFNFIDSKELVIRKCKKMEDEINAYLFLERFLQDKIEITATGFMVRSKDYDSIGGIPPYPDLLYADIVLWHQLILQGLLIVSPEVCFGFRTHSNNTSKGFSLKRLRAFEMLVHYLKALQDADIQYHRIVSKYGYSFLKNFVKGSCHKLIYVPRGNRNEVTMQSIIDTGKRSAFDLLGDDSFSPQKSFQILIAKCIDNNLIFRNLFLLWKSLSKRVY